MHPVEKLILVNESLGVNIGDNQATTRTLWDTVPTATPTQLLQFFKNSNVRQLPLTNLTKNKLEVDGNVLIQKIILLPLFTDGEDPPVLSMDFGSFLNLVGENSLFNLKIGNSVVLKDIPLSAFGGGVFPSFLGVQSNEAYGFFTPLNSIDIPPQIEFEASITCANVTDETLVSVRCILQGFGTQFSNTNY